MEVSTAAGRDDAILSVFQPGQVWLDTDGVAINAHGAGLLYHDGTYYLYGEFKIAGTLGNTAQAGVSCYSSTNLYDWKNEGIALPVSEDPAHDLARGCVLERPKVLYNKSTGRFVMWFHLELRGEGYNSARVGVAWSETPIGPFHFEKSFRPDGAMSRDLTLFLDPASPDEAAYLFTASEDNRTLHIARLSTDYLETSGQHVQAFPGRYMEAPAVFYHQGQYWFIGSGCTGWEPNAARLAHARAPMGPWQEKSNPCVGPGAEQTFGAQSTYILPVANKPHAFIFIGDIWTPNNPIDGRYLWLPIEFEQGIPFVRWRETWSLDFFA